MTLSVILNQIKLVQSYLKATKKNGPSEQLLAFINYDNSLGAEIGLEDFDSLSLQARHEILIGHLTKHNLLSSAHKQAEREVEAALEGLGQGALLLGIYAGLLGTVWGGIKLTQIVSGKIVEKASQKISEAKDRKAAATYGVISHETFRLLQQAFENAFSADQINVKDIPSDYNLDKWEEYSALYDYAGGREGSGRYEEYFYKYIELKTAYKNTPRTAFNKSGWSSNNYISATKWLVETSKKLDQKVNSHKHTLEKLNAWLKEHKHVYNDTNRWDPDEIDDNGNLTKHAIICRLFWAIDRSVHGFSDSIEEFKHIEKELKTLSYYFEEVK